MAVSLNKSSRQKIALINRTLGISWNLRKSAVLGYLLGATFEVAGSILTIYASAQLANLLAHHTAGQSASKIWFWLVVDILSAVAIGVGFWVMSFFERLLFYSMVKWSISEYMLQLCSIDFPDFYDQKIRDQINKVESGFSWIMPNLAVSSLELCYGIIRLVVITALVAQITWWLLPVIALFLVPSLVTEAQLARSTWFVWDSKGDERHVFWSLFWIFKQARAQMEVRSLQAKEYLTSKITAMNEIFYKEQEQKFISKSPSVFTAKVLGVGGTAIGSVILIFRFLRGSLSFERYLFLSGALLRIGGAMNAVFGTLTRMQEPILYAENFYKFIDRPHMMIDRPNALKLTGDQPPHILFENVSFSYPESKMAIFDGLNLEIKPGEHLAIVGENGAGKSTLIKLLLRFYVPSGGRILIDGQDLNDIAIDSWYSKLATLFQDFNQYPFTIRQNIEMKDGHSSADDNRLARASKLGGVDSVAKNLPKGFETILDSSFKEGVEPSGGQYQRIALARAFYREASLIILDEPTAAIDARAEYEIFNNIFGQYKNKTAIIVSHRFSTVRRAARIVVLDQGKIAEEGSHDKLMKHDGLYKDMFSKQAEGYL